MTSSKLIDSAYDRNTLEEYDVDLVPVDMSMVETGVDNLAKLTFHKDGLMKGLFISEFSDTVHNVAIRLEEKQINYIILYGVKELVEPDICKLGYNFLMHPELKSIPAGVCKRCAYYCPRKALTVMVREYLDDNQYDLYLNRDRISEIATEMDTCSKCLAPVLLAELNEEPIVVLSTVEKIKAHFFIRDSGTIDAIKTDLLGGAVVLGMEYINQKIPKYVMSMVHISDLKTMKEIKDREKELEEYLAEQDVTLKHIPELVTLRDIKQYIHLEKKVDQGIMRSVVNPNMPNIVVYSYQDIIEVLPSTTDFPDECSNLLYASAKKEIENRIIRTQDGITRAPMSFQNILRTILPNEAWIYMPSHEAIGKTKIYAIPPMRKGEKERYIVRYSDNAKCYLRSRKKDGKFYIGDTSVAPGTFQKKENIIVIEELQYHRCSEREIIDYVDLNGGDFYNGAAQFTYDHLQRHIRYADSRNPSKLLIAWPPAFYMLDLAPNMTYMTQYKLEKDEDRKRKNREKMQRCRDKRKSIENNLRALTMFSSK